VSPTSGFGNATVTVTINNSTARYENIEDFERSGMLTVTVTDGTEVKTISIVQKGMAPLAITKEIINADCLISPNPSNGSFTVDNSLKQGLNYKLVNALGVTINEGKLNAGKNTFTLNLSKGVYLFLTESGSKKISIE
jgi:hypothetical protein